LSKYLPAVLWFLAFRLAVALGTDGPTTVTVGVYQDKPLIFFDTSGRVKGIYADILEYVASRENLRLVYVPGTWPECLEKLKRGEIDLLAAIAYSPTRAKSFDFTSGTIVSSSGMVFVRKGREVKSILDLDGLTIAGVKGDFYLARLRRLLVRVGAECNIIEMEGDFPDVLALVRKGEADAGVVSRLFALSHTISLAPTPIMIGPAELRFAAPKGKGRWLLTVLDRHLAAMKKNPHSIYYQSLEHWLSKAERRGFPPWLLWALGILAAAALLAAAISIFLKIQVRARTAELAAKNRQLKRERDFANNLIQSAPAYYVAISPDGKTIMMNKVMLDVLGYSEEEVIGTDYLSTFVPEDDRPKLAEVFRRLVEKAEPTVNENRILARDGRERLVEWHGCPVFHEDGRLLFFFGLGIDITERRSTEEALRRSEREKEMILATVSELIIFQSSDHRIIWANRAAAESLGLSPEQIVGRYCFELWHGRDKVCEGCPVARAFETLSPQEGEIVTPDRRVWWIKGYPVEEENGQVVGAVEVILDISRRKRAEQEREGLARLGKRLAGEPSVEGIAGIVREETLELFDWDAFYFAVRRSNEPSFRIVSFADTVEGERKIFPTREWPATSLSKPVRAVLHGTGVLINRSPGNPEPRMSRFGNKERPSASMVFAPIRSGEHTIGVVSVQSYTHDRYSEEDLAALQRIADTTAPALERAFLGETERRTRMIAETVAKATVRYLETGSLQELAQKIADEAVRIMDARLAIVMDFDTEKSNRRRPRIIAIAGEDWDRPESRQLAERIRGEIAEKGFYPANWSATLLLAAMQEGVSFFANAPETEMSWVGDLFPGFPSLESFLAVPSRAGDEIVGIVALANRPGGFSDAEVREMETLASMIALAMRAARSESERIEVERRLHEAMKMEAIGRLAGGIAHDFNNLLTTIGGYAELGLDSAYQPERTRRCFSEILDASERAASLTKQLLAFSRRQPLEPKVVNLNHILSNIERLLGRLIGENIELVTLPADDLWPVRVDPGQIEQVLANLAVNARDAMPEGGKLIIEARNVRLDEHYARSHAGVTPGEYVMLAVTDTGCGMTDEVKAHLFEPFFTTKEPGKGTGLGLATCYAIVERNGGHIWVYSEPGKGTTFKIYLPRARGEPAPFPARETAGEAPRGSETILLVEDEPSLRSLAAEILRNQGYEVIEASGGDEALRLSEQGATSKIDLLLTDVIMPGMGGEVLAERLKAARPGIKVLFVSGHPDDAIARDGVIEPEVAFLQKPFTPVALARKVREVLDGR